MTNNVVSIFKDPHAGTAVVTGVSELAKAVVSGSMMRRIQTNTNGTFRRLIGGEQQGKAIRGEFNAIVVAMLPKVGRTFYAGRYDPDAKGTLPDCWSDDGVAPVAQAKTPQAKACERCPNNIDGSGENGKGKACRFNRRVALMLDGDPDGHVYQLNIPAKSLFGKGSGNVHPFESYLRFLVTNNTAPDYVVTNIAYDLDADTMQMVFTPVRPITRDELVMVEKAQRDPDTQRLIRITVGEADGILPKAVASRMSQQQTIAPVAEDPEPEEVEAVATVATVVTKPATKDWLDDEEPEKEEAAAVPAKRVVKKVATAPMTPSLASTVDEWLTDAAAGSEG